MTNPTPSGYSLRAPRAFVSDFGPIDHGLSRISFIATPEIVVCGFGGGRKETPPPRLSKDL